MRRKIPSKRVISFLSQKGGVGKSSLASLLAFGLTTNPPEEITIVDADTAQSSLTRFFRRRKTVLNKGEKIKVVLGMNEEYESYISKEGHTIFDMPGMASKKTLAIAKLSTHIFLPINATLMTVQPQVDLANEFFKRGISASKIAFVFTLSRDSLNISNVTRYMKSALMDKVVLLTHTLPYQVAYEAASNMGKSFTEVGFKTLRENARLVQEEMVKFVLS